MVSTSVYFKWGTMKEKPTDTHGMHGDSQEQHTDTSEHLDMTGPPGLASPTKAITPQDEIKYFMESKEAGMISTFTKPQLWRAAETLYTANGLDCPVRIENINGETVLINREIYERSSS